MNRRRAVAGVALLALVPAAWFAWRSRGGRDERELRGRIEALRADMNASTLDGLGTLAHAAHIGSYFTDDVTIDLGRGATLIQGRETLMGMAARLQPRTAAFRLELDDISVELAPGAEAADVLLTASFVRRSLSTGEESRDAREFSLVCQKSAGIWRIARVTGIDTLR